MLRISPVHVHWLLINHVLLLVVNVNDFKTHVKIVILGKKGGREGGRTHVVALPMMMGE